MLDAVQEGEKISMFGPRWDPSAVNAGLPESSFIITMHSSKRTIQIEMQFNGQSNKMESCEAQQFTTIGTWVRRNLIK